MHSDTIGARISEERRRLGKSQEEFATIGGVGRTSQTKYENDSRRPDADYLARLSAVGVDVFYILTGNRVGGVHKVGESQPTYSIKIYDKPEAALYAVLDVQQELGLTFNAEQLRNLLGYAYMAQATKEELLLFVRSAYTFFGEKLPSETEKEE